MRRTAVGGATLEARRTRVVTNGEGNDLCNRAGKRLRTNLIQTSFMKRRPQQHVTYSIRGNLQHTPCNRNANSFAISQVELRPHLYCTWNGFCADDRDVRSAELQEPNTSASAPGPSSPEHWECAQHVYSGRWFERG